MDRPRLDTVANGARAPIPVWGAPGEPARAARRALYLRQHADNPVDWYPWGEEALGAREREDRPILLSIGYSACHWCHVMAHECVRGRRGAAMMNELFVNVKVDREERPDVDALYMQAVARAWPATAAGR